MTELELKMILKLIDLRTCYVDASRENYAKIIRNVEGLKKDITDLFGNGNDK